MLSLAFGERPQEATDALTDLAVLVKAVKKPALAFPEKVGYLGRKKCSDALPTYVNMINASIQNLYFTVHLTFDLGVRSNSETLQYAVTHMSYFKIYKMAS